MLHAPSTQSSALNTCHAAHSVPLPSAPRPTLPHPASPSHTHTHTGAVQASYDRLTPSSVVLTTPQPRAALKQRSMGAKQPQCEDMCSERERTSRMGDNSLHDFEREVPGQPITNAQLAVKVYQRSGGWLASMGWCSRR
jgi:hypothetical protein